MAWDLTVDGKPSGIPLFRVPHKSHIRIQAILIGISLLILPLFVTGYQVDIFQDGNKDAVADLITPDNTTEVRFEVPAESYILSTMLNVSTMSPSENIPGWPESVRVLLNGSLLWEFNGTDYGALGMQDAFINHTFEWTSGFNQSGGTNGTAIRLPKNAIVQHAVMDVDWTGQEGLLPYINLIGTAQNRNFGYSVSYAGDVNSDGYDDVIVAVDQGNNGTTSIYFGGANMDRNADVVLTGESLGDDFGISVSGARDVNGDGYDDVVVGANYADAGGANVGRAYVFFGGTYIDSSADVILTGEVGETLFGNSVSGAGDVNNDGYDDIIVGAYVNNAGGSTAGRAYIYFGGPNMDNITDVVFTGGCSGDRLGCWVSDAGDVNNDGYDDVIVGANGNDTGGDDAGGAYIFFGGADMDNIADVIFTGETAGDLFGIVSGVGDVNKDGFDDVAVGALYNNEGGIDAGKTYIYFGGTNMDSTPDGNLIGEHAGDYFGRSVSGPGDVNNDGYDDIIVGAYRNGENGADAGKTYIYFGGANINSTPDIMLSGAAPGDSFGFSVSSAGDFNKDGYADVIIGAAFKHINDNETGMVYLYHCFSQPDILDMRISVANGTVFNNIGCSNGINTTPDFSPLVNDYLISMPTSGTDDYGNAYIDVPVVVNTTGFNSISLDNLNITYNYTAMIPDFSNELNAYIVASQSDKDANGHISVPITIYASSSGRVKLLDLNISMCLAR